MVDGDPPPASGEGFEFWVGVAEGAIGGVDADFGDVCAGACELVCEVVDNVCGVAFEVTDFGGVPVGDGVHAGLPGVDFFGGDVQVVGEVAAGEAEGFSGDGEPCGVMVVGFCAHTLYMGGGWPRIVSA